MSISLYYLPRLCRMVVCSRSGPTATPAVGWSSGHGHRDLRAAGCRYGNVIPGTGRSFELTFSTTARWEGDLLVEEYVFWDSALMAQQIGIA